MSTALAAGRPQGRSLSVEGWETRIRRTLLVAHAVPATFGLLAVTALLADGDVRRIDIAVWAVVVCWDLFLLLAGWRRIGGQVRLARWVLADACVMAVLAFIGTPARSIVIYAAVEGALFAAVFVSARIAVLQVAIVYSAVGLAALARHLGSDLPSPNTGWLLPLTVTLVGVMALHYLGAALRELDRTTSERERAVAEEARLRSRADADRAVRAETANAQQRLSPLLARLEHLTDDYLAASAPPSAAATEAQWVRQCLATARTDLEALRVAADEHSSVAGLLEAVRGGIANARAVQLLAVPIEAVADRAAQSRVLDEVAAQVVVSFTCDAVTNALMHGAGPVQVRAEVDPDGHMTVAVLDRGPGFDPDEVSRGLGLETMRIEADRIGARVHHGPRGDGLSGHRAALAIPPRHTA